MASSLLASSSVASFEFSRGTAPAVRRLIVSSLRASLSSLRFIIAALHARTAGLVVRAIIAAARSFASALRSIASAHRSSVVMGTGVGSGGRGVSHLGHSVRCSGIADDRFDVVHISVSHRHALPKGTVQPSQALP